MEFGKFKDATSLFDAYKSLEKVFTQKCQEAKNLSKKLEEVMLGNECAQNAELESCGKKTSEGVQITSLDNATGESHNEVLSEVGQVENEKSPENDLSEETSTFDDAKSDLALKINNAFNENSFEQEQKTSEGESLEGIGREIEDNSMQECAKPISRFKTPEWRRDVARFFANNPEAKEFKSEIARFIMSSPAIWNDEDCLSKAFIALKNNRPASNENALLKEKPETLTANGQDTALSTGKKEVKDLTVGEYLQMLAEKQKLLPKFVRASKSAGAIGLSSPREIRSLSEAKDYLLKNYFK